MPVTSSLHIEQSIASTRSVLKPTSASQSDSNDSLDAGSKIIGGYVHVGNAGHDRGEAAPAPTPAAFAGSLPQAAQTAAHGDYVGGAVAGLFGSTSSVGQPQQQAPRNPNDYVQSNPPAPEQAQPGFSSVQTAAESEAPAVTSGVLSNNSPSFGQVAGAAIVGGRAVSFIRTTITRVVDGNTRTIAAVVASGQIAAPGEAITVNHVLVRVSMLPYDESPRENVALALNAGTPASSGLADKLRPDTGSASTSVDILNDPVANIAKFAALAVALPSSTLILPATPTALTADRGQAIILSGEAFVPLWNNHDAYIVDGQPLRQGGHIILPDKNADGKPETAYLTTNTLSETVLVLGTQTVVIVQETATGKGSGTTTVGAVGDYIASGIGGRIVPTSSSAGQTSETSESSNGGSNGVEQSNDASRAGITWDWLWPSWAPMCVLLLSVALL